MSETYRLDEVQHAETLLEAEVLAQAAGRALAEHQGRMAMGLDLSAGPVTVHLPLPEDCARLDLLALEVCTAPGITAAAHLRLELASRTAGLPLNDFFDSGRAEEFESTAWREVLFPQENFLLYGIPPGWRGIARARLRLSGNGMVWVAKLAGRRRRRAAGPRLTDAGLLDVLDLQRSELAAVRGHAAAGCASEALAALLKHLQRRAAPAHIYGRAKPDAQAADLPAADRICANFINGYDVGRPVDWRCNPNGYLEWMHAFNRHVFFNTLLQAYQQTGAVQYVHKLDELFRSWIAANPEPVDHNGGGDPGWETLCVAVRIYGSWLECFFALLNDEHFSAAAKLDMLKSFHGHAEHVFRYKGYANNWLIVESRALALLGLLFPEFKRSDAWIAEGLARLEAELPRQIFPDGADWEFAPGYHTMAVRGFLDVYEVAKLNGRAMPPVFEALLPRTFEYIAGLARPDGSLPAVNDATDCLHHRDRGFLETGARLFGRPDLLASPEGPFAGQSRHFPDSGFAVQASGTGAEARWLLCDAGPFGASHQHEDALSLEVFAHGVPFIVDPGISSYLDDAWTAYYRDTRAHSTVLVNGAGQHRRGMGRERHHVSARGQHAVAAGPVFDYLRASYRDGYKNQPEGLAHTRTVLFLRGDYWIVFDEVTGAAAERMDALFHFAPMRVEYDSKTRRVLTRRLKGANLELVPLEPRQGLKVELVCGAVDPVQGWVSVQAADLPAPVACYSVRGQAPLRFAVAIAPFTTGVNSGLSAARLPKLPPEIWGAKLSLPDGRADRVFVRLDPSARIPRTGTPLDADVLVERLDARGRRVGCAWVRGHEMTVEA